MANIRTKSARVKTRTIALTGNALVRITENGKATLYSVSRIASDFGDGYAMSKIVDGRLTEPYHVNLADQGHACDCKGALAHGHKTLCKHVAGIIALLNRGLIAEAS